MLHRSLISQMTEEEHESGKYRCLDSRSIQMDVPHEDNATQQMDIAARKFASTKGGGHRIREAAPRGAVRWDFSTVD
jgi:hypothetical protein